MFHERMTITKRALVQRINRVLANHNETLHVSKGKIDSGQIHIVSAFGFISRKNVDLEKVGQELRVFKAWEQYEFSKHLTHTLNVRIIGKSPVAHSPMRRPCQTWLYDGQEAKQIMANAIPRQNRR